jgi:membrane-associated phospholipid phosphatase
MPIQLLCVALGLLATVSMLLFFPINNERWPARESTLVRRIPFIPAFILPYLGLFPYIAFSMLAVLLLTPVAIRLYVSLIFAGIVAALVWYFMPTGTTGRPEFTPDGPFKKTVAWMYSIDPGGNALPSSHTYTAVVCSYYLAFVFPLHEISIWACGGLIISSTLFVKQHHFSDLVAGIILGAASIGFSYLILGGLAV